ncbi:MAG: hypothetical protein PHE18_04410 [Candidatus Omnitrophica bacterium]|nr:hypothetical protein [Candidatus Omnitrophota bacterium]MDD5553101.1 hypothetical protein [Candidatus Omnitrophota bacterium]
MISRRRPASLFLIFLFYLAFPLACSGQDEYSPYPGIIHIHSNISQGGVYSLRRLSDRARESGIRILVFGDDFLRRWEYGPPVFSRTVKISIEEPSASRYGIKKYLQELEQARKENPGMLLLEGFEVAPFYWWSGSVFRKNLTMNDWNRHLLVTGLNSSRDYEFLPVTGNRYLFPRQKDLPGSLTCLFLTAAGIFFLKKKNRKGFLGMSAVIAGILYFFAIFPFSSSRFNPFQGYKNFLPYQELIDYVRLKGGAVFWAHPETSETASGGRFMGAKFYTPPYPESLEITSGYTGFCVNLRYSKSCELILPGGEWDRVLISYCERKRLDPAWVIGEMDYRREGPLDIVQNIFLLPEFKAESAYDALRKGRLYVRYYSKEKINISLDDFHVEGSEGGQKAFMGNSLKLKSKPVLKIKGDCAVDTAEPLRLEIIRYGKIVKVYPLDNRGKFDLIFEDDPAPNRKSYYRLNFLAGSRLLLASNPVFIET